MNCECIFLLLPLLSFHLISIIVFMASILISIRKKTEIPYYDMFLYLFTFAAWGGGFYLSDKYGSGFGFGKTLGNISEILLIGILMLIYMLTKVTYLMCRNVNLSGKISRCMAVAVILLSFFIGVFCPGIPE